MDCLHYSEFVVSERSAVSSLRACSSGDGTMHNHNDDNNTQKSLIYITFNA
jgi:hypothetical protein